MHDNLEGINREWRSWFVGFVDGEGYFQIEIQKNGHAVVCLNVTVREDDKMVLEEIQSVLGIGHIYEINRRADRQKGKQSHDQFRWVSRRIKDVITVLIPLFDEFPLRTKKARDYQLWREAAFLIKQKRHLDVSGKRRVLELWAESKANRICNAAKDFGVNNDYKRYSVLQIPLEMPIIRR